MTEQKEGLQQTLRRLAVEYADDPNIETIGYGLRYKDGEFTAQRAILFFVRRKYASQRQIETAGSRPIPAEIEGYPTDVQLFNVRRSVGERDETSYDPLIGGVASSNADGHIYWFNGFGTLGLLVRDAGGGTPMALSNWHVWGDGGDEGDDIIQPGHPTGGDHVEGVTKVLACGPLITSLIEWEVPSPLTLGLYGGAAAAGIAAAASDYRDPTRRGQDETPTDKGELTQHESVRMDIEYHQLPLPGVAFRTDVKWTYQRQTDSRLLTHEVEESRTNTQFLLGKLVTTDKQGYQPGDTVRLTAAIWDYKPRPCDAYHVVAHLIPHARPNTALRVVLHPSTCPRTFPQDPPDRGEEDQLCVIFANHPLGQYPAQGKFEWLSYLNTSQEPVSIVDWFQATGALQWLQGPLLLTHEPASRVVARVVQFTNTPVTLIGRNAAGTVVDQATAPNQQGVVHEVTLNGDGIVEVVLRGGGGEGLLISYCIDPLRGQEIGAAVASSVTTGIRLEEPDLELESSRLKGRRCCFTGSIPLPPDENPGKWDVHLTVQNVNHVPKGTPPEEAAKIIGGHVLSSHTSAEVLGCTTVMLLDHVFDVI